MARLSRQRMQTIRKRLMRESRNCFYCHDEVTRKTATVDHLIPVAKGGTNDDDNLVLACTYCNCAKADMTLAQFVDFVASHGGIQRVKWRYGGQRKLQQVATALTPKLATVQAA